MSAILQSEPRRRGIRLPWAIRRFRRRLFYLCVRALVVLTRLMPRAVARLALRSLGALAWVTMPSVRNISCAQLARALPDKAPADIRALARESVRALADNLLDMVRLDASVVVPTSSARILEEVRNSGPILVLMGHQGAWELVGPALVQRLSRFGAVTADPHNERVGRWLNAAREKRGIRSFDRNDDLRAAAKWLRSGGSLAVLGDHRTQGTQVAAEWFGEWAPTAIGPSRLAKACHASILPVGLRRLGDEHQLIVRPPFAPTGDPRTDARRCNEALESIILESPSEWTWFHDRYGSSTA